MALLVRGAERPLLGVGVGTAGVVDASSGVVRWAVGRRGGPGLAGD